MSASVTGVVGMLALFALLALRVPVAFSMFVIGFLGIWALNGLNAATSLLASEAFTLASSPELVVIPLFILMGNVASQTGMSRQLFDAAYAVIGSIRGRFGFGHCDWLWWLRGSVGIVGRIRPDHGQGRAVGNGPLQIR